MKEVLMDISDDEQEEESDTNMDDSQEDDDSSDKLDEELDVDESDVDEPDIEGDENGIADKSLGGGIKKIKLTKPSGSNIIKPKYPTMDTMVMEAIFALKDRKGSSAQAIHKYIKSKWPVDDEKRRLLYIWKSLKACTTKGDLEQVRLSFKISANWKKKEQEKEKTERKAEKKLIKNKEAKEKKKSEKENPKKEKTKKTSEKKPPKDKKADSIKPKPRPKSKVAAKEVSEADEEVTTKKSSEKKLLSKKAKIRKSIGTLRPDVAKPLVKSVKKMVAGGKSGKKKATKEVPSESSDKENEQFGLEPKSAASRTKNVSEKPKGKTANPSKKKVM